jgi:double-stranded uracil-DNA glycosylase
MAGGLPDILAPNLSVVFCGLNPGAEAAATGHHFVGRGNRFWRVLHLAGFTPTQIDPMHDTSLLSFGCGLTAVVARPTASADEAKQREIVWGRQAIALGGAMIWVLPNPSGRNFAFSLAALVEAYGQLRRELDQMPAYHS